MKQNKHSALYIVLILSVVLVFGVACFLETNAWARAGGGSSSGSRGSRSYSAPSMPSSPSPSRPSSPGSSGYSAPGYGTPGSVGTPPPSSGGWFSRSPFLQGMAGGMAGGFLGNMLFGGHGYAGGGYGGYGGGYPGGGYPGGGYYGGRGGIGLMDIIVLGIIGYLIYRWWSRRRRTQAADAYYSAPADVYRMEEPVPPMSPYYGSGQQNALPEYDEVQAGFQQLRQYDPTLDEEGFKETAQDLFFRIQAGWMNRSLAGIENLFTPEMARFFNDEFSGMKQKGTINRLENIAVRKVQPSEIWQEAGKDYITVLFTANLLDYTVDDKTGNVVSGDKMNPVKFEEFWTFTRDTGPRPWQLSAINQVGQPLPRYN